jgi:hypothetical protein
VLASRHHVKDSKATQARPLQEKQVLAINYQVKETEAKLVQEKQVLARNHHVKETEAKEANLIEERQVLASKHHVKETDRGNASQSFAQREASVGKQLSCTTEASCKRDRSRQRKPKLVQREASVGKQLSCK